MRISHCILKSIEGDLYHIQNLKFQFIMGWVGYFQQIFNQTKHSRLSSHFKNSKLSGLGIDHAKVYIIDVGGAIGESVLSTFGLQYVTNFKDLWTLVAFKSQTQQQYCFQSRFNLGIVNYTLYINLNLKGIFALCKVYLISSHCQAETPHN